MILIETRPAAAGPPGPTELPSVGEAVHDAREIVNSALDAWGYSDLAEDAALIMSELATNAVLHGGGTRFGVSVTRTTKGRVRLAVTDTSKAIPFLCSPSDDAPGGRGLHLVDALSQAWGTDLLHDRKTVWAELAVHPNDGRSERPHPH